MAPATNWLSFSVSPAEMMSSSGESQYMPYETSSTASPHYLIDNFYANGWANPKQVEASSLIDHHSQNHGVPKLEDFLGDSSVMVRYSDSQTETQDSSLTQIYDHGSTYFNDQQDLKALTGFQAFSANSGSEVDDSASMARNQLTSGEFTGHSTGALSLGGFPSSDKLAISMASDSSKKIVDTFGQRTSIYRGVTRHRWTGRYEAHLWDNTCRREGQARKGRQVYLGGYDKEDKAAKAYDLAALKYWGPTATTNFPVSNYTQELEEMKHVTKQEFIASLRRKSSGFSRGASMYRGVTRHHQQGRWQARIGRVAGNKDLYLGTFATEEEAAEAYDIAAIKFRGLNAMTNFEMRRYDVEAISNSNLPIGGAAKRLKLSLESEQKQSLPVPAILSGGNNINFSAIQPVPAIPYGIPFDGSTSTMLYHHNLFHHLQPNRINSSLSLVSNPRMAGPMNVMPQPAKFFVWPHQFY